MNVLLIGLGGLTQTFRHWPERILALALARRGHTVLSIGIHDPKQPALAKTFEKIEQIPVYRVPGRYFPNKALAKALNQGPKPDLIHLLHPRNVLAAQTTAWAQKHKIPTVYTWLGPFHDSYATEDRERPFEAKKTFGRLIFQRRKLLFRAFLELNPRNLLRNYRLHWPLWAAKALLPCSAFEAALMRQFGLRQPQTVIPLWIDLPFIQNTPLNPPKTNAPRPWLLFVGQLTPRKGYDLAVEALATLSKTFPTASLLIVSGINHAQKAELLSLANLAGVAQQIHFLGHLSDQELINLYRFSDVFLFPTRYEGFGLPLLEAMAAECALVTTDLPVVREIVHDGKNGLLVPYNDSVSLAQAAIQIIANPALKNALIAGGKATLQQSYQEELLIQRVEDVYHEVKQRC